MLTPVQQWIFLIVVVSAAVLFFAIFIKPSKKDSIFILLGCALTCIIAQITEEGTIQFIIMAIVIVPTFFKIIECAEKAPIANKTKKDK